MEFNGNDSVAINQISRGWNMLVFISDVHLTDGSSGTTIVPRAFDKLSRSLEDIIQKPSKSKIRKVDIVLLGDIFDVIRSSLWLRDANSGIKSPVRPWSDATDTDKEGWNLQKYTEAIVDAITKRPDNIESMGYLKSFSERWAKKGVKVTIAYIIGNHDWLINRFASTRKAIAEFSGIAGGVSFETNRFAEYAVYDDYKVMARHGDYYDNFNYEGNRDASSIGDAIVIDLLNRFAEEVRKDRVLGNTKGVADRLREIDNVRPLLAMPAWIQGVCNEYPGAEKELYRIWNGLVDNFFKIQFVEEHGHIGPDYLDFLKLALRLSSTFSFSSLKALVSSKMVKYFSSKPDEFRRYAYNEAALKSNSVRYVVYGHTHSAEQVGLDVVALPNGEIAEKIYFNTGTWRKVFEQTAMDDDNCEFIGWHVGTFVLFYLETEREKDRCYETWTGSLGYARA
jgi:UDP-2,3-diacylglucosamine pyrophosphatase LpxH